MSMVVEAVEKTAAVVVKGYRAIENGVVGGYKAMEQGIVTGFNNFTDQCVKVLFARKGETVEEAKKCLSANKK